MQALVLAGGLGSRLGSRVKEFPKPFLAVDGKPFLIKIIERLRDQGVTDLIMCVGYKAEKIISFFGNGASFGINISYSIEKELLGTAGAILNASNLIYHQNVIVLNGDSFCHFDIPQLMKSHVEKRSSVTLALVQVDDSARYGIVRFDGDKRVVSFEEKRDQRSGVAYINAGVYVLDASLISSIPAGQPVSLEREVFPLNISNSMHAVILEDNRFIDIGTPASLDSAEAFFGKD